MISLPRRVLALVVLAILLSPALSLAHLMPEGNGSTRLVDDKAYTLISIPVGVLEGFDDDRNGAISVSEASAHYASLQEQIERLVWLSDGKVRGKTLYSDLQVPHFDSSSMVTSKAVIHIRVSGWDTAPKSLLLHADVFTKRDRELAFRAILGDSTEHATLTASRREAGFFGAQVPVQPRSLLGPALTLATLVSLAIVLMVARRSVALRPQTLASP